jgi:8-hydroxy-5-deazaflavin:NADPH oxidoreductase
MNIAVIGAGKMGSGLGGIWAKKGHSVVFSYSRNPEKLEALAKSNPGASAASPAEAVRQSDLVLLSVPWSAIDDALKAAGPLDGKIVIDCTNPITPTMELAVGLTTSAAEEIAKRAPGAKVVKAFNTAFAELYHSDSRLFGSRMVTMFYCGDDGEAKKTAAKLIGATGFTPIDCGPLKYARCLEPVAMLMIQLGRGMGMGTDMALTIQMR